MTAIQPTQAQLSAFAASDMSTPVCMVNLLKFKDTATYAPGTPEASENLSGQEAYGRYAIAVYRILDRIGAKPLFSAPAKQFMIGNGDWDRVALVWYPSRQAFLDMSSSAEYRAIHYHRAAGLAHQDLIETLPGDI